MLRVLALSLAGVVLTACAGSTSPTPIAPQSGFRLAPDVWQRGTPPVRWEIFANPTRDQGDDTVFSWPVLDKNGSIDFGGVCCYPAGDLPTGNVHTMNYSGTLISSSEPVNHGQLYQEHQNSPIKIFQCAGGTQICTTAQGRLYGPNNAGYFFGSLGLRDAAAGAGNAVWATIYGAGNYIVSGINGVKHFYALPVPSDQLQAIAVANDGNVWVTLQDHATKAWMLARLQPGTSHVTVYPLQLSASPAQLLVGPDSNIWFALGKTLYRLNAASAQITRFQLPQPSNGYLNTGRGATLWTAYVNNAASQGLMEISDTGAVLGSFACPTTVCVPGPLNNTIQQAVLGADGNIWFAFSQTNVFIANPPTNSTMGIGLYIVQSMSVSPNAVTFIGPAKTQTVTFSEANYAGTFTAQSTSTAVVRVVKMLSPHEVEIQSVAKGSARIIIRDTMNNYYGLPVTVQ